MTRTADAPEDPATPAPMRADVCIIGAGIVGLFNALQYAKRGLSVVLIDHLTERGMASYKVGESLLVYANAFLRTIGELDDELTRSRGKLGFWMAYGMEHRTTFGDDINEWGFQARLPQRWLDAIPDRMFARTMFGDVQIVRPDIEAAMRATVRRHHQITFIDTGHVRDVQLGDGAADHLISWTNPAGGDQGHRARPVGHRLLRPSPVPGQEVRPRRAVDRRIRQHRGLGAIQELHRPDVRPAVGIPVPGRRTHPAGPGHRAPVG